MPQEHISVFETTLQKTNEILKEIENRLGWQDRHKAYLAFRAVLHPLRDRLPVDSAASFAAQLPLLLKGVFYDGWKPAAAPMKMKWEEFVNEVERVLNPTLEENTEEIIREVLAAVGSSIDPAEMQKIKKSLPKEFIRMLE